MPTLRFWWVLLLFLAFYVEQGDSKKKKSTDYYQVQYYAPTDYYGGETKAFTNMETFPGVIFDSESRKSASKQPVTPPDIYQFLGIDSQTNTQNPDTLTTRIAESTVKLFTESVINLTTTSSSIIEIDHTTTSDLFSFTTNSTLILNPSTTTSIPSTTTQIATSTNGTNAHADPLQPYYGVVYGVTAPVIIIFIYVAALGIRGLDVRRWMVLNVLLWMIWYGMLNADGADHSPWKGWLGFDPESSNQYNTYFQELAISTITGSLSLLYIESIVSSILYIKHPKARYSIVYNIIWFIFYIPVLNGIQLFCFIAKYQMTTTVWWYDPIDCLLCVTYLLAYLLWLIHFIFTLVLSCLIPICGRKHKDPQTEFFMLPVLKMWLVFIYGIIPKVLIIPYASVPLVQFLFTNFADEMLNLMKMFTSGGFGVSTGGLPSGGDSYWLTLGLQFMGNRDYFMLYLPFVVTILSILCFPCFYRPLLILISCGRICSSNQKKPLKSPPPSYPGNVEEKKILPS